MNKKIGILLGIITVGFLAIVIWAAFTFVPRLFPKKYNYYVSFIAVTQDDSSAYFTEVQTNSPIDSVEEVNLLAEGIAGKYPEGSLRNLIVLSFDQLK